MSLRPLTHYVVPLVVFPLISYFAFQQTLGHIASSGLRTALVQQCPLDPTSIETAPYRLKYTGVPGVDKRLCGLVTIFHFALAPEAVEFTSYFVGTAVPLLALPALESFRKKRSFLIAFPVIFGLVAQLMTVGVTLPIYWLIFILTGQANLRPGQTNTQLSRAHVGAVAMGLAIGAAVPSLSLVVLEDPYVTAICQFFPLLQFLVQYGFTLFQQPSPNAKTARSVLFSLYMSIFALSAATHLKSFYTAGSINGVNALLIPSLAPLTSARPSLQVRDFLQWDAICAFGSTMLATFWFLDRPTQILDLALWYTVGSVILGPGAAIAVVALWRESHLHPSVGDQRKQKQ
ncbi:hypothetical protein B0H16DRAFT_189065 [Mycena metata]|uniref:Uncharacterized protein n=1 Tax=Mycena metata TaxID=1033252 RepID=A0AAD7JTA9_9AGAR|nr:hypothetical protein B0H16DRAFT_189065 [Mycena metata]